MTAPRVEIDLGKIRVNARSLVRRLGVRGITVTGVTKGVCGHPDVARAMLDGGVVGLVDARIRNIVRMRMAGILCPISMIRAPMIGEMEDVIRYCDASYNSEMETIRKLGAAARKQGATQDVILMVEMGDMREGVMPEDLDDFAARVVETPGVTLKGIAANFGCMGNLTPTTSDMATLSRLADQVEGACGPFVAVVSGGGSANLAWALDKGPSGRVNNLRLGEAILLGIDPATGRAIDGLHTDAFAFFAEVIETRHKPAATGARDGQRPRSILAVGWQDTDANGLGFPHGVRFIGATSDHTVVDTSGFTAPVGSEMRIGLSYSALMRAMSAPDVAKAVVGKQSVDRVISNRAATPFLTVV